MLNDTIAAIATAPGEAGIAVIRISGPASPAIADSLFVGAAPPPSRRPPFSFAHGRITSAASGGQSEVDPAQDNGARILDEVILLIMRAPHSYTREDVVEIQCHGGALAARRILQAVLNAGARLAEPGEFTQRAFLNGRIDLLQAEAVLDLIRARTDRAASAALEQLGGSLSNSIVMIYDGLLAVAAEVEAALDFSEDDLSPIMMPAVIERLTEIKGRMAALLKTWEEGHLLREGAVVVISGKPNVGKSTLLNLLLGKDRAIVSAVPGTTRDTIEETLVMDGISLRLVDTAGLRATNCDIEREGVRRARHQMQQADIHLHVMDSSMAFDEADSLHLSELAPKRSILILNKSDLENKLQLLDYKRLTQIQTCLLSGAGVDEVRQAIVEKLGSVSARPQCAVISERHRQLLLSATKHINEALFILKSENEALTAVASSSIRAAIESLGYITGKQYHPELLKSIFSKFCVGK